MEPTSFNTMMPAKQAPESTNASAAIDTSDENCELMLNGRMKAMSYKEFDDFIPI